ncbi:magnesium transporter [Apibacter adventoris]|uniref:Magnesium transporter MgtE n=1 Tax=Apibacter adventoris TaxID=1679466 RepID=A0A2S8A7I1_9FLAO|nr:magnesium transporter [Apibacter adventoris]PQL90519.1 magnesium transporter [Apibacter adventoris]PQL95976.1 magnesium transporter [Apibacter adventoris]
MEKNIFESTPVEDLHPKDIAEQLAELNEKDRILNFFLLPRVQKTEVFTYLDPKTQQELLHGLGKKDIADLLNEMAPDDRTDFFVDLPDDLIKNTINLLDENERKIALQLLGYPEDSIGRLMTPNYIQAKKNWTVKHTLQHIKKYGRKAETLNFIYIVDNNDKLLDDIKIGKLLLADDDTLLSELCDDNFIALHSLMNQEEAIHVFEDYDRTVLPVISEMGTLVGIVTVDDILDIVKERDTEDIQKFGGLEALDIPYRDTPLLALFRKRAGWLIILFLGEMLTASAMVHFEEEIEKAVVLALFVPLIISSGGNSGSQAATLIIRAMALHEIKLKDWWYVMKKEIFSGILLGITLGIIGFIRIVIWQNLNLYDYGPHWCLIGITVATSLIGIVLWGTLSGSMIPFILRLFKLDPATSSAPFVATMVDVTGLIIYFTIASLILRGVLL